MNWKLLLDIIIIIQTSLGYDKKINNKKFSEVGSQVLDIKTLTDIDAIITTNFSKKKVSKMSCQNMSDAIIITIFFGKEKLC